MNKAADMEYLWPWRNFLILMHFIGHAKWTKKRSS